MKTAGRLVLLLALAGPGCMELPHLGRQAKPAPDSKKVPSGPVARLPRPVTASQVNEQNAQAMADSLEKEIARDEQTEVPGGNK